MLAKWQAMPLPMTPEPNTATFLILLLIDEDFRVCMLAPRKYGGFLKRPGLGSANYRELTGAAEGHEEVTS